VVVAGAALTADVAEQARRRGLRVVTYYGAAELSFVAAGGAGREDGLRAFPGVEVAVRDGEIWVRSPYVALDYLRPAVSSNHAASRVHAESPDHADPSASAGPWRRDRDGWSTVGDRAHVGPDGSIVVLGRGEAAVQTGGATVHVADVEHALRAHPGITDVVVTGVPHPALGQVVTAVVESSTTDVPELRAWAQATLPSYARPRRWAVVDRLPRTPSGKADRGAVPPLLRRGDIDE
jgi:long-chain acyl-CoA synthetase